MWRFLQELRRRRVFTVAVAYGAVAWALLEAASILFPTFGAPEWVMPVFTVVLFLGLPLAIVLAWAYDITPAGVVRSGEPREPVKPLPAQSEHTSAVEPATEPQDHTSLPDGPSIAVMPFRNLSGEPDQDLFAEALTGDIVSGLTQYTHLFVLSSGSISGVDARNPDVISLGKKLNVEYLLQGSVRKTGEQLRVTVQLLDAGNGVQLWSQSYDRQLSAASLFEVQDHIREQIVATLGDMHGVIWSKQTERNVHRPTHSLNAYECLSVALAYDKYLSEDNHQRARDSLERAIALDPEFDEAWAHLSWIYTDEWLYGYNELPDARERALAAAQKGIKLAPRSHHNHWLLARVHYFAGERELFLTEAEKSLRLNSNDGTTVGLLGLYLSLAGEGSRGIALLRKAALLNPNHPDYYYLGFGIAHMLSHDYDAALDEFRKMNLPEWMLAQVCLTAVSALLDHREEALRYLGRLRALCATDVVEEAQHRLNTFLPYQPDLIATMLHGLKTALAMEGATD